LGIGLDGRVAVVLRVLGGIFKESEDGVLDGGIGEYAFPGWDVTAGEGRAEDRVAAGPDASISSMLSFITESSASFLIGVALRTRRCRAFVMLVRVPALGTVSFQATWLTAFVLGAASEAELSSTPSR
jgi:hypothetical protein